MLEIFGIIALCKLNKKNAIARGRRPGGYIALTISLWVGLEILGAFVAGIYSGITGNELGYGYLFFAYGFAGIGALISFLCAKFGPTGDYVDPSTQVYTQANGQPVYGNYNAPAGTPAYMVNPQTQPVQPQEFVHVDNPYQAPVQQSVQYCEFCGQQLKPGVKFCASCGTKVEVPFGE